jgi:hypothetical protein
MAAMPSLHDRCTVTGRTVTRLQRIALAPCLFLAVLLLSGCVTLPDPEASQEFSADAVGRVEAAHTVGQTFVARRPRLNGVELWLDLPAGTPAANLLVELFPDPSTAVPMASTQLTVSEATALRPLRITFAPQDGRTDRPYFLRLTAQGGAVHVLGRNEDAYPRGQAFSDDTPVDADIAFRLLYDYNAAAMLGDLLSILPRVWLAVPLAALLFLPGWLLLDLAGLRRQFDGARQAALALGLSLSLVPLLLLWTTTIGLRWNGPAVITAAALLAALAAWRLVRHHVRQKNRLPLPTAFQPPPSNLHPPTWILPAIFVISLLIRLAMVRDLAAPAWVDSVHHALITQLIVDQGALPASYAPVLDVGTASYHTGFHSVVAALHWLSGLDVPQAMLLAGQVLNALAILAAYLLAVELTEDRVVGLAAALLVGLVSPMPAYYASWGRYTQLAGLLILPAAIVLVRHSLTANDLSRGSMRVRCILAVAVALGGLLITHYRVAAFYGCYLLAYLAGQRYGRDTRWREVVGDGLRLVAMGGSALVLVLPWIIPALDTLLLPKFQAWSGANPTGFRDFSWRYLTGGLGAYLLVLAAVGLAWAMLHRRRFALTLLIWVGLLFCLAGLGVWGLPGAGLVNFVSVEIALFLPLSVLGGYLAGQVVAAWRVGLPPRWRWALHLGAGLLAGGMVLWGAGAMLPLLNVDTVLFRQADGPAIRWIRDNAPADAVFLINPMPWSAYMYAGHDGGYWIGPLAGRQTLPPPALYGLGSARQIQAINELCAAVLSRSTDAQALWELLREHHIGYVYSGARGGVLSTRSLAGSDLFSLVYSREGVQIWQVQAVDPLAGP